MNLIPAQDNITAELFDQIADQLEDKGYIILPSLLPAELTDSLFNEVAQLNKAEFQDAGIGRDQQNQQNNFVRTDEIRWLNGETEAQAGFLEFMSTLRLELNRRLFLGLFDYECHFAHYAPGDFYKRHLDAFHGKSNRVLSTVVYLNPGWTPNDGGELLMYEQKQREHFLKVTPMYGSCVIFLSERFPHEVLKANRDRYSIAGWFRINNSIGGVVDPAR